MPNRNRKNAAYTGSPWAHGSFEPQGYYPSDFMGNPMGPMMGSYMQSPFNNYGGGGPMYNRGYNNRKGFDNGNYQRNQNNYGGNRRFNPKGSPGRNNYGNARGNKRPSGGNRGKAKKAKTSEPYNPAEPTGEEEDDGQKESNESDQEQSSKFGANAPPQDWKYAKNNRRSHYCTVCERDFAGSFLIHRRTKDHRKHRDKKFPRCRLCRKTFQGMKEFEEHGKTEEHRKKSEDFQALKEQQLVHAALSDSEDDQTSVKRYISNQGEEKEPEETAEAVGTFHVVPLKIFFCKLCQKVFSNYTDGRQIHCRTADHIQKYKVYFDGKEARAAERNRLKKEEEEKKKKEAGEADGEQEGEGEEADQDEEVEAEQAEEEAGEEEEEPEVEAEADGEAQGEEEDFNNGASEYNDGDENNGEAEG